MSWRVLIVIGCIACATAYAVMDDMSDDSSWSRSGDKTRVHLHVITGVCDTTEVVYVVTAEYRYQDNRDEFTVWDDDTRTRLLITDTLDTAMKFMMDDAMTRATSQKGTL